MRTIREFDLVYEEKKTKLQGERPQNRKRQKPLMNTRRYPYLFFFSRCNFAFTFRRVRRVGNYVTYVTSRWLLHLRASPLQETVHSLSHELFIKCEQLNSSMQIRSSEFGVTVYRRSKADLVSCFHLCFNRGGLIVFSLQFFLCNFVKYSFWLVYGHWKVIEMQVKISISEWKSWLNLKGKLRF